MPRGRRLLGGWVVHLLFSDALDSAAALGRRSNPRVELSPSNLAPDVTANSVMRAASGFPTLYAVGIALQI